MSVIISYISVETGSHVQYWLNLSQDCNPWSLRLNDLTGDLVLICSNSWRVLVHQAVLLPLSAFLQDLVPVCCPCTVPAVTLAAVSENTLRTLVELLYTGKSKIVSEEEKWLFEEMIVNLQIELVNFGAKTFTSGKFEDRPTGGGDFSCLPKSRDFKQRFSKDTQGKIPRQNSNGQDFIDEISILAKSSSRPDLRVNLERTREYLPAVMETRPTPPTKKLYKINVSNEQFSYLQKASSNVSLAQSWSHKDSNASPTVPTEMHSPECWYNSFPPDDSVHQPESDLKRLLKCAGCDTKIENSKLLSRHVKEVHKKNRCTVCGKWFDKPDPLTRHNKSEHSKSFVFRKYDCKECGKQFSKKCALSKHKTLHSKNPKTHNCLICSFKSFDKDIMINHVKCTHCTENVNMCSGFLCYVCNIMIDTFSKLKPHVFLHVSLGETSEIEMTSNLFEMSKIHESKQAQENERKKLVKKMFKAFM